MALKPTLATKAEVDALPEAVRGLYTEKDGKFRLDVEGDFVPATEAQELKTKLAEFRDNNRTMHGELESLRPLAKKFEGVDPDEYKTLKSEVETLKKRGIAKPEDVQALIDTAIAKATKPLADELTNERKNREAAQKAADDATFRELITAQANTAGVSPTALRHVLREAELVFELKDKALTPKAGVKHPTDPLKDMTPNDWLLQLAKTDDYLFKENKGGGAPGAGGGGPKPGAKRLINPTPVEMGQNLDAIAKGEMVVVRQ
jgi:hypothetical protein